mgnify:CR=1 FL=1
MPCRLVGFAIVVLAFASQSLGFEVGAVIRKIDINQRVAQVFANGKDRAIRIAGDAKILDKNGKDLSGGLGATELKEGSTATHRPSYRSAWVERSTRRPDQTRRHGFRSERRRSASNRSPK